MLLVVKGNVQDAVDAVHAHDGTVVDHQYDSRNNSTNVDAEISLADTIQWYCEPIGEEYKIRSGSGLVMCLNYPVGTLLWHNDKEIKNDCTV